MANMDKAEDEWKSCFAALFTYLFSAPLGFTGTLKGKVYEYLGAISHLIVSVLYK